MKLIVIAFILTIAAQAQSTKAPKAAAKPAAAKPAPKTQSLQIPKEAVEFEPGSFRYTDASGKKWIYRKTPFGVARLEDKPAAPVADPAAAVIKATDGGDVVKFERPGPFGTYRWERKKSELTDAEKTAWERSRIGQQD